MPPLASPQLAQFLATEDLDDLLEAVQDLGPLSGDDEQVVRSVLSSWRDEQAVSNLLIHCALIPADIRIAALVRGLDERDQPYFILAATLGVQTLRASDLCAADRVALRDRLLEIIYIDNSIIAKRATVSLPVVLTAADGERVCRLLEHPNDTVRHNLLSWLVNTFAADEPSALHRLLGGSGISDEANSQAKRDIAASVERRRAGGFSPLAASRLSWIPNLSDTKP